MKFNGTKTRVLTIALAVICTLAPLSQTMAAGQYRTRKTTGYRNVDRKDTKKSYLHHSNSSSGRTDNDKVGEVVTGIAILAIVGWLISDSFNNNNNEYNKSRQVKWTPFFGQESGNFKFN